LDSIVMPCIDDRISSDRTQTSSTQRDGRHYVLVGHFFPLMGAREFA